MSSMISAGIMVNVEVFINLNTAIRCRVNTCSPIA